MMTVDVEAINYINILVGRADDAEKKIEQLKSQYEVQIKKMREDLAEYDRAARKIWEITRPMADDETPLGDLAEKIQDHVLVILKGRERPEWTLDRVTRERDEARAELYNLKTRLEDEAKDLAQPDMNELNDEIIAVRMGLEKTAFKRGAEIMRALCDKACLSVARSESYYAPNVGDECAEAVRKIEIPEYDVSSK